MKKNIYFFILILFASLSINMTAQGFAGGSGTIADPFLIATVAHMEAMHTADYSSPVYYKLTADIDMEGINWMPVNSVDPYKNHLHFDGNGHVIKNLTVAGFAYSSLFGVLCGSCKNLGVIDADITSSNPAGIIAGYVGLKGPNKPTGIISNCYTTGIVRGGDAVGGIAGNIGKPNGSDLSIIQNCYSTAEVISLNEAPTNSRAGGVVGIVFEGGVLKNSYATGRILSGGFGAGGVVGWSDASINGVVAMNSSISNTALGNIGRISSTMGTVSGVIAQGVNCWASDEIVVMNENNQLSESDYHTGEITEKNQPFDGITKSVAFLSDPMNYFMELEWDFASENNIWAQEMSNGKPIFQWLADRSDHQDIDGHNAVGSGLQEPTQAQAKVYVKLGNLHIAATNNIQAVAIYNATGQEIYSNYQLNQNQVVLPLQLQGVNVINILVDGQWETAKILSK